MKRLAVFALCFLILFVASGCRLTTYSLRKPIDQIDSIEIVYAKNCLEYTVRKTLTKEEQTAFLEEFRELKFHTYIYGDPSDVFGDCVKITYLDGTYEIIGKDWASYVREMKPGKKKAIRKNCDDDQSFVELINRFCGDNTK